MSEPSLSGKKAQFAALPLRAISDGRLTDRDVRILAAVAAHDRMSHARGKGQGAWASHKTMAAIVGGEGADYARFSVSINRLVRFGYLQRDRLEGDLRKHTYRIIYTDADRLPPRKPMRADDPLPQSKPTGDEDNLPNGDRSTEIVCRGGPLSGEDREETRAQYISLSEEIDSAEAGEIDSDKPARSNAREVVQWDNNLSDNANLARLDRALKHGSPIDAGDWCACLALYDAPNFRVSAHVQRLSDELEKRMTAADREAAEIRVRSALLQEFGRSGHRRNLDPQSERSTPGRACEKCGATFVPSSRGIPKRFCSEQCRKRAERHRWYEKRRH